MLLERLTISVLTLHSLDYLIERIWDDLGLVKIYTKKRGVHPDLSDPVCLRKGATIEVGSSDNPSVPELKFHQDVCNGIHRSLAANFRYGLVW
jgi:ribosome-interacting GTPase 1